MRRRVGKKQLEGKTKTKKLDIKRRWREKRTGMMAERTMRKRRKRNEGRAS
jgi:hypothetical protein